jgi:predicted alpha/beta superfamily hydrolase
MVYRWDITIPALTGEKTRKAFVYVPASYENSKKRFPVLYMFDGHNLFTDEEATFGKCWGLEEYLNKTGTQLIVAAVECNTEGNGRLSEYSPLDFTMFKSGERIKGRGKTYMDWLVGTFKPLIDENFRTLPDRANAAIAGSSMGGLMTLFALAKYNKFFGKGAALSPSLWTGNNALPPFLASGKYGKDTVLYMDYGSKEFANHAQQKQLFFEASTCLMQKNVLLTTRIVPNGSHCEASWERQIPLFMRVLGFEPEQD